MKLALLLPGYLDSPDYLDMVTFDKKLTELGYTTERLDAMQYSAEEEIKNIHVPLMIFIALDDTTVPPEQTERIVKNAISPHVVRQSHMKHDYRRSQKDCDVVMKEIEKFLLN